MFVGDVAPRSVRNAEAPKSGSSRRWAAVRGPLQAVKRDKSAAAGAAHGQGSSHGGFTTDAVSSRPSQSKHLLIATGSRPAPLHGIELHGDRIGTSTEALSLRRGAAGIS